jgi:DNA-3-methyladenine glycosylase II
VNPTPVQLRALARNDPALGLAMKRVPPFPGFPRGALRGTHFHAISRSIVYQQLATAAAATIYGRVRDLTPGRSFPKPTEILEMPEGVLRSAGLSRSKLKAIRDLAEKSESGEVKLRTLGRCTNDEVVDRLTQVWGVGEWTAQMFLMFKLGRLDVMAPGDLGLQEGMRRLDGLADRPSPQELHDRAEAWRPLRTVAAWTLWRLLDMDDA